MGKSAGAERTLWHGPMGQFWSRERWRRSGPPPMPLRLGLATLLPRLQLLTRAIADPEPLCQRPVPAGIQLQGPKEA